MTNTNNKPLIAIIIIIGIIIIVLLLSPRNKPLGNYSYRGTFFATMSPVYSQPAPSYSQQPQVIKTYGHPITVKNDSTYYYSYPVTHTTTTYKYLYPRPNYPEGCTAYTAYSATTGWPCR